MGRNVENQNPVSKTGRAGKMKDGVNALENALFEELRALQAVVARRALQTGRRDGGGR